MGAFARLKSYLEWMRAGGAEWLAHRPRVAEAGGSGGPREGSDLAGLAATVAACRACPELARSRTQTVFGAGNPGAELVFVGEAPGQEEDRQGLPFVGAAGGLLTKMIAAIGLSRQDVYICNVLKCRPPANRTPHEAEISNCLGHLEAQLAALRPRVICALGKVAAQTLLASTRPISALRGRFHSYRGIPVMPTFHPSYLLRNEGEKRKAWEDFKKVRDFLAPAAAQAKQHADA